MHATTFRLQEFVVMLLWTLIFIVVSLAVVAMLHFAVTWTFGICARDIGRFFGIFLTRASFVYGIHCWILLI